MIEFFVFILGLSIGSFLNVCIYRIPMEKSIVPSSHCKKCGYNLKWYDLVPVLSYVFLRGKCRKCDEQISIQYPVVELINGGLYLLLFINYGMGIVFLKYAVIVSMMIVLAVIDLNTQYVYSVVSWSAVAVAGVFVIAEFVIGKDVSTNIYAVLIGGVVFAGINLLSKIIYKKVGLGGGDVEVIAVMALTLGVSKFALAFFLSVIIGAAVCIILLALKVIKRESYVAFVPFLASGTIITMLYGDYLINCYINLIKI